MVELLKRVCGVHLCRLWVGQGPDDAWAADLPEEIPREYPTRCLGPRELIPYVRPDNGLSEEFLLRAQEKGDQCVATFHGGEVVSYGFDSFTRTTVNDQLDIDIPHGLLYGYKGWTHEDFRRRGMSHFHGKAKFQRYGFRREKSVWYVDYNNYASLLNNRYTPPDQRPLYLGTIGWINVGGRKYPFNSRRARWLGVVFIRKDRPSQRTYPYT